MTTGSSLKSSPICDLCGKRTPEVLLEKIVHKSCLERLLKALGRRL